MENDIFMNAGIPPPLQFEPSSLAAMSSWQSLSSSAMKIQQTTELNSTSDLFNSAWGKSTMDHQSVHNFDSGLGSMVSSPAASNSNIPNDSYFVRELIGKLGNIGSSAPEISPHPQTLIASSAHTSCYSTPLSSPPKMNRPVINQNFPNLVKSIPLSSSVAEFSADPGFAERAAKFSCFGSRSFNRRTSQIGVNGNEFNNRSNLPLMANGKLQRVASSPSLKVFGLQNGVQGTKKQSLMELTNSVEESTVSEQTPHGDSAGKACSDLNSRKRKASSKGKGKESASSPNTPQVIEDNVSLNPKRCKANENDKNGDDAAKAEEEPSGNGRDEKENKSSPKPPEPPKDYIHVRARRGQATDSHSLAERVRREKISERMKLLQDLVPGCNKVTGKALMLDEIINYVQSLQRQVEFLSMKMASVNTRMDCSIDHLMSKDMFQSSNTLPHPIYRIDSSASAYYGHHQPQQNQALHNNVSNVSVSHSSVDHPLDSALCQNLSMQLPILNDFCEILAEYPTFSGDDLQTIVQMGFSQNLNTETAKLSQSQSLQGSSQVSRMKVEL